MRLTVSFGGPRHDATTTSCCPSGRTAGRGGRGLTDHFRRSGATPVWCYAGEARAIGDRVAVGSQRPPTQAFPRGSATSLGTENCNASWLRCSRTEASSGGAGSGSARRDLLTDAIECAEDETAG